jgi:hypothetical protein
MAEKQLNPKKKDYWNDLGMQLLRSVITQEKL